MYYYRVRFMMLISDRKTDKCEYGMLLFKNVNINTKMLVF